jgi:hypothetical protein
MLWSGFGLELTQYSMTEVLIITGQKMIEDNQENGEASDMRLFAH